MSFSTNEEVFIIYLYHKLVDYYVAKNIGSTLVHSMCLISVKSSYCWVDIMYNYIHRETSKLQLFLKCEFAKSISYAYKILLQQMTYLL